MVLNPKKGLLALLAAMNVAALAACDVEKPDLKEENTVPPVAVYVSIVILPETDPTPVPNQWNDMELQAIAKTLAGECYEDRESDKRMVCEVILNRVSDGRWGGTVIEVLEYSGQFYGYWTQNRPVTQSDLEIAERALADWYANGCNPLSDYLYFNAGDNRENEFRSEY